MYKTELMDEILKSPKAQEIVQMVSPIYGEAYTVLWLYEVIGTVLDTIMEQAEGIREQAIPQTATWGLPYWEEQYKLPINENWTVERRRQAIVNQMHSGGAMNPTKMENIVAAAAGAKSIVEEHTGKNHFTVHVYTHLDEETKQDIIETINNAKPAQLIYDLTQTVLYENAFTSYWAAATSVKKTYQVDVNGAQELLAYVDEENILHIEGQGAHIDNNVLSITSLKVSTDEKGLLIL